MPRYILPNQDPNAGRYVDDGDTDPVTWLQAIASVVLILILAALLLP